MVINYRELIEEKLAKLGKHLATSESEVRDCFIKHYKELGFKRIIREQGWGCDFIMEMNDGKKVKVELEYKASSYRLHPIGYADVVICAWNNDDLSHVKVVELSKWLVPAGKLFNDLGLRPSCYLFLHWKELAERMGVTPVNRRN
jgi:hypothetical protein